MNVRLVSITPDAEQVMGYCARVSSPQNQDTQPDGLLRYCMAHGHWSVFEMADATVEIETSRAVSAQIVRHRSLSFQEFSTRYANPVSLAADLFQPVRLRRQDTRNRQNSIDDLPPAMAAAYGQQIDDLFARASSLYQAMLADGVAKECARMVLPLATTTRLYAKGSVRSWIHYLAVRCDPATQAEHREVACAIRTLLARELPIVAQAAGWV